MMALFKRFILASALVIGLATPALAQFVSNERSFSAVDQTLEVKSRGMAYGSVNLKNVGTGTYSFQGCIVNCANANNWFAVYGTPKAGGTPVASATADGTWTFSDALDSFRVYATIHSSGVPTAQIFFTNSGGGTSTSSAGSVSISGTAAVQGAKTNNNAAPGGTNVGALVCVANAAAPSQTEGNIVALRCRLDGAVAVYSPDGSAESNYHTLSTAAEINTSITGSATVVTGVDCENPSTTTAGYIYLYNKATAPAASDGALLIAGYDCGAASGSGQRGGFMKEISNGLGQFTSGLGIRIIGNKDHTQTTAAPADLRINIQYHGKVN